MLTTQSTDVSGYVSMWPVFLSRGRAMCVCVNWERGAGTRQSVHVKGGERVIDLDSFK